jgi:ABC-type sugar transport system substrate-binding protein
MRSAFRSLVASAVIGAFAFAAPAAAQQKVKIGFITTFSGPQGVMGQYIGRARD